MKRLIAGLVMIMASTLSAQTTRTIEAKPTLEITDLGVIAGVTTLADGSILVGDASNLNVLIYSKDGRLIKTLGRKGSGPGEFRSVLWVGMCGSDTVAVRDIGTHRLTYIVNGKISHMTSAKPFPGIGYQVDKTPSVFDLACSRTGDKVLVGWPIGILPSEPGPYRSPVNLGISKAGTIGYSKLGTFDGPERYRFDKTDGPRRFGKQVLVAMNSNSVFIGSADSFYVGVYDYSGKQKTVLGRKSAPKEINSKERNAWETSIMRRFTGTSKEHMVRASLTAEKLPTHLPAYNRFIVDDTRLWIQEYHAPTELVRTWWGFEENGKPLGSIVVPVALELFEINETSVVGKWTAADGSDSVRRYRLKTAP